MKWFSNLKISYKFTIAFCIYVMMLCIIGLLGIHLMSKMNDTNKTMNSDSVNGLLFLAALIDDCRQYRNYQYQYVLAQNESARSVKLQQL